MKAKKKKQVVLRKITPKDLGRTVRVLQCEMRGVVSGSLGVVDGFKENGYAVRVKGNFYPKFNDVTEIVVFVESQNLKFVRGVHVT